MTHSLLQTMLFARSLVAVLILAPISQCYASSLVLTVSGPIRGEYVVDEDVSYYSFRGIPYAEPPTGNLRFKRNTVLLIERQAGFASFTKHVEKKLTKKLHTPPVPKAAWSETFKATNFGPVCPQTPGSYSLEDMSEDCLTLNVYVPATQSSQLLPVLIETPSGEFRKLSARDDVFGPQFYMQSGVILITFQYRLGALGFLSVLTEEAAGNAGLKDALLMLKWVRENIAQFGGDPENVSFGGNSSGSAMVHYFLLSEKSSGLFHKAFLRSGSALGYRFLNRYPVETAMALGSQMGYKTNNIHELMQYLRQVDAFDIINATRNMETKDKRQGFRPFSPFVPVVERESVNAFITKEPIEIVKSGITQNVPIIVGFNAQEGISMIPTVRKNATLVEYLNDDFELCIPSNIEYPYGSVESVNLAKSIKSFYFNGEDISNATIYNYIDLISDTQFTFSIDRLIQTLKTTSNLLLLRFPIYYYVFDFDGDLNFFKLRNNVTDIRGTAHVDDFGYMFATESTKPLLPTASEESLQTKNVIMTLNTNFIKYGVPTPSNSVLWSDYSESGNYLVLNNHPRMMTGSPIQQRLQFWYKVYEDYETYRKNGGAMEPKIVP